jgi:hypothetical protein
MVEREQQGGTAALTALISCPLEGAIDAAGRPQHVADSSSGSSSSGGNGNGGSSAAAPLAPESYVWVRPPRRVVSPVAPPA